MPKVQMRAEDKLLTGCTTEETKDWKLLWYRERSFFMFAVGTANLTRNDTTYYTA